MDTPMVVSQTQGRMRLPALRRVMIAGLAGNVLVFTVQQVLMHTLIPPLAIILALTLAGLNRQQLHADRFARSVRHLCGFRWR